ncbi:MAG: tRNA (N6-isopentenyl adenosine(37)-C2)-methylthiotransferase MiaB [Sediminibacterium sp.]
MKEAAMELVHDETRQGEVFEGVRDDNRLFHKFFYIESYGCAMNFADSEVIASLLQKEGYGSTLQPENANLILINTCSIRDKAEQTIRHRLTALRSVKQKNPSVLVGILGCMAERLKEKLLEQEQLVDLVVGPDAYRSLPSLIASADEGNKSVNVLLSREETYGDIAPVRLQSNGVSAFISIMRGCNNMCSFCVVPFTRGRERSRDLPSILQEARQLLQQGYRDVTLLGQNVDSYYWVDEASGENITFARLLEEVALLSPLLRVRFSTSHPKDITDEVLLTIQKYPNICRYIHLPVQSGSNRILQLMNRTYTREWYLAKVARIREILPGCAISTDVIAGFCTETEEDHQLTLDLMQQCDYDLAYMYFYSERPGTLAERRYEDDVPEPVKKRRLQEIIDLHRGQSLRNMRKELNAIREVLIEGDSKKSDAYWQGRTTHNKMVVFPKSGNAAKGEYVNVHITDCTAGTLMGEQVNVAENN